MTPTEAREQACTAFLEPTCVGYIRPFDDDGKVNYVLFDDMGDPLVIGSVFSLQMVAINRGMEIHSVH